MPGTILRTCHYPNDITFVVTRLVKCYIVKNELNLLLSQAAPAYGGKHVQVPLTRLQIP